MSDSVEVMERHLVERRLVKLRGELAELLPRKANLLRLFMARSLQWEITHCEAKLERLNQGGPK